MEDGSKGGRKQKKEIGMKEAYGCYDQFPRDKPQRRVLRGGGIKFCVYVKQDVTVDPQESPAEKTSGERKVGGSLLTV